MILRTEQGIISLVHRNNKRYLNANGIVGVEALQEYLYLLYPESSDFLRHDYLRGIDEAARKILDLADKGGILTYHGGLSVVEGSDQLPKSLMQETQKRGFLPLRAQDFVREHDPKSDRGKRPNSGPVYMLASGFRENVGYKLIARRSGVAFSKQYYLTDEGRQDLDPLIPAFANVVRREYDRLGIEEYAVVPPVTVVRQLMFDVARIWGRGRIE